MWLSDALDALSAFMDKGGPVLWIIALATFLMWTLVFERVWYFNKGLKADVDSVVDTWEGRAERDSWNARSIREALISRTKMNINAFLPIIKTIVALCPLLGLLGTVTGMIMVFDVLSVTGGGDAKSMAGGVSRATIPTMAGMVAALSGVFANTYLARKAERESQLIEDHLTR